MSAVSNQNKSSLTPAKVGRAAVIAGVVAAVANVIVYLIANAAGAFPADYAAVINVVSVALSSFMGAIAGGVFYFVLSKFVAKPARIFRIIAVVFAVLSLGGPIGLASGSMPPMPGMPQFSALSTLGLIALGAMHVIAGGVVAYLLPAQAGE